MIVIEKQTIELVYDVKIDPLLHQALVSFV